MIIHDVVLPADIQLEIVGGPNWNTSIVETGAGWSHANINWADALWYWKIKYIKRDVNFDPFIAFFLARRGRAYGFEFFDWTDHSDRYRDQQNGINQSIGKVKLIDGKYRLCKVYPDPILPYTRIIQRPISGTVTLSGVEGTPVVDYNTGIVSGATSEGNAAFEFRVPVMFDSDRMEFKQDPAGVTEWTEVGIREVRVDVDGDA